MAERLLLLNRDIIAILLNLVRQSATLYYFQPNSIGLFGLKYNRLSNFVEELEYFGQVIPQCSNYSIAFNPLAILKWVSTNIRLKVWWNWSNMTHSCRTLKEQWVLHTLSIHRTIRNLQQCALTKLWILK